MDHNAGYVWAGYALVAATLGGYSTWLRLRIRRAQRSLPASPTDPRDG